jgi:hypothetical protein
LELNDDAKQIVRDFCAAINTAVENSSEVANAIARLREAGYDMELTLRLDIGLREHAQPDLDEEPFAPLELTDDDRRTLQRMRIRIDEDE